MEPEIEYANDCEKIYNEVFKSMVENPDGTFNREAVMRELADYARVSENAARVFQAVTRGAIANPHVHSDVILAELERPAPYVPGSIC